MPRTTKIPIANASATHAPGVKPLISCTGDWPAAKDPSNATGTTGIRQCSREGKPTVSHRRPLPGNQPARQPDQATKS